MKTIILAELAILAAASACGSARATTPDTGSTFAYSSRQQVTCITQTMGAQDRQVQAQCPHSDDLPLSGGCSNPGPGGADAILAVSSPGAWEVSSGVIPGWLCVWTVGGAAVNVTNGQATMCCVVKSQ